MNTLNDMFTEHMKADYKSIKVNGIDKAGFFKEIESKTEYPDMKYLFTNVGVVKQGDIIDALEYKWLIISEPISFNGIYTKAIVQRCNFSIKFIFEDGIIRSYPTIIDTKVFNVDTGQYMTIVTGKIVVRMQDSPESNLIKVGNRFIKTGKAFTVTYIDKTVSGITILNCESGEFNIDDDKINEVADAKKYFHTYTIDITNNSPITLNYQSTTAQITIQCKDNDNIVSNPSGVVYSSNNEYVATVDSNGIITCHGTGTATITVTWKNVSDTVEVRGIMETSQHNYSATITGLDIVKVGQTKAYTVTFADNGASIIRTAVWGLFADNEMDTTDLAIITAISGVNGETCTIKANSILKYGYVKLKAWSNDNICIAVKRIQIKSLV